MIIELKSVKFAYGRDRFAIDDVSIQFPVSGLSAIIGRNGSGKSTLLKLAAGLIRPQSGRVFYEDKDIKTIPTYDLADLRSFVPQNLYVRSDVTVKQFVSFGLYRNMDFFSRLQKNDSERVDYYMETLEIIKVSKHRIWEISGGELQKAHIARALVQNAKVLLMDEPVSNIDLDYKFRIMSVLKSIAKEKCVILVTHDVNSALNYADEIIALKEGKMESTGSPEFTANALNGIYERRFLIEKVRGKYIILDEED